MSVYAFLSDSSRFASELFCSKRAAGSGDFLTASCRDDGPAVLSSWPPNGVALSKKERALLCNTSHDHIVAPDSALPCLQNRFVLYCNIAGCTHAVA